MPPFPCRNKLSLIKLGNDFPVTLNCHHILKNYCLLSSSPPLKKTGNKNFFAVQKKTETGISIEDLHYLPAFAHYLLSQRLDELSRLQVQISREIHIPLLKRLEGLTEEKIQEISKRSMNEMLTFL